MNISITGRHLEITTSLKNYATKKIERVQKYAKSPLDAHIILSVEKYRHFAEVNINFNGTRIHGREETEDMYSSLDKVIDKVEHQVKKHKEKIVSKKHQAASSLKSTSFETEEAADDGLDETDDEDD